MFSNVLSSISRFLWKDSTSSLLQLPSGEFYMEKLVNGRSRRDCLMQNSEMTIMKASDDEQASFQYTLVIENILDEPDQKHDNTSISFDICDTLSFSRITSDSGGISFKWKGPIYPFKPDSNTQIVSYEWIPDKSISAHTLQLFHYTIAQCLYERTCGLPYTQATDQEIQDILQGKFSYTLSKIPNTNDDHISGTMLYTSPVVPFFIFDPQSGHFVPECDHSITKIIAHKDYSFSLVVSLEDDIVHQQFINPSAVQHVDRPTRSFVWCLSQDDSSITTFSLRFSDESSLFNFANIYARCVYEILNHESMNDLTKSDSEYLVNPFIQDVDMADIESSEDEPATVSKAPSTVFQSSKESEKNRQLVIGHQYDRSFVSRGSSIGVFKNKGDDGIEFVTNIKGVETLKSHKKFSPSKMLLYDEDSSLLLMNPNDQQTIYRMDLEVGKVIDEWKADEYTNITNIIPDTKYSSMTPNKTFIGINKNSIFRMDPRLSGSKKVETESKQYVVKNDFTCGATTGNGELAVASKKGDIRLFNKLDKRAKTLLPGFGDPIIGIDVTENGKYILATCKTYLLLICTEIEDGVTGFTKSMKSDNKPLPKRLALKPEHVAYMGETIQFTEAHFSTGPSEERAIIASTGPYVITWSLRSILKDKLYDYQIKKYSDTIVADNFEYGHDDNIIVTLPDQVTMIDKSILQSPKNRKSFHSIVDSPF